MNRISNLVGFVMALCLVSGGCETPESGQGAAPADMANQTDFAESSHSDDAVAIVTDAAPIPDLMAAPICGDGIQQSDELCDDGNAENGDGCDTNCTPTACGNGIQTRGEACDDGNLIDGDGCDGNCIPTGCGNGILSDGESCDDGNDVDGDGCDSNCTPTSCGNGIQTEDEACDDGNDENGDGCDTNCTTTGCGNGIQTEGEACDDGNDVDRDECRLNCALNALPNIQSLRIEPNDAVFVGTVLTCIAAAVDDNEDPIDYAYRWFLGEAEVGLGPEYIVPGPPHTDITCRVIASDWSGQSPESSVSVRVQNQCGDGFSLDGEACDDGNDENGDGCDSNCTLTGCGNGIQTGEEACDDGNDENGDGCDVDCSVTGCGNGIETLGEACDDGNLVQTDGCTNDCLIARCGDGFRHLDVEECDTGLPGQNGCDEACEVMVRWSCEGDAPSRCSSRCGDGQVDPEEECDPGANPDGSCTPRCLLVARCGDGVLQGDEACDDGNVFAGDGCSPLCTINEDGLHCEDMPALSSVMDIQAQASSLTSTDDLIFWVSGGRVIQRLDPVTAARDHRYFQWTLRGRQILGLWAMNQSLILHMAAPEEGEGVLSESIWQLSAADFLNAEPTLIHSASEIDGHSRYHRIEPLGEELVVLMNEAENQHVLFIHPTRRPHDGCAVNEDCGLRHTLWPRDRSTPLWRTDEQGQIYGVRAPSSMDASDGTLFRLDRMVTPLNVDACLGDHCTIITDELPAITSYEMHRGAVVYAQQGEGFRIIERGPSGRTRTMNLPGGERPMIHRLGQAVYLFGDEVHRLVDWTTQETSATSISAHAESTRAINPGFAWLMSAPDREPALVLERPAFRRCYRRIADLVIEGPSIGTTDVASAGTGVALAGGFVGGFGGVHSEHRRGLVAQWNHRGVPRQHWIVSSTGDSDALVTSVDSANDGGIFIAGTACKNAEDACQMMIHELQRQENQVALDMGLITPAGIAYILNLRADSSPEITGIARPRCVSQECDIDPYVARSIGSLRYLVINHHNGFDWIPVTADGPGALTPMGQDGERGTTLMILNDSGGLVHAVYFPGDEKFRVNHLTIQPSDAGHRLLLAGSFRGAYPQILGDDFSRSEIGFLAELSIRTDGRSYAELGEARTLLTARTQNFSRLVGADIAESGHIDFIGHSYDDTQLRSDQGVATVRGTHRTQAFMGRLHTDGSVETLSIFHTPDFDQQARGILSHSGGQYISTANSANTAHHQGSFLGGDGVEHSWRRSFAGPRNTVSKVTRPRSLSPGHIVVGGHSSAPDLSVPFHIATDAPALDRSAAMHGAHARVWVTKVQWQSTGAQCEDGECTWICGDGLLGGGEECDDGNALDDDGCSSECTVRPGFACPEVGEPCRSVCGDGRMVHEEACDDGNRADGDGCSFRCRVEPGFTCDDAGPSVCQSIPRCEDTGGEPPCYDEATQRCTPAELCDAPPRATRFTAGAGRCIGNNCLGQSCHPSIAGDTRPCGGNVGACAPGRETCNGLSFGSCVGAIGPTEEVCNGIDDDCDGVTDEGIPAISCGLGECGRSMAGCRDGVPTQCQPGEAFAEVCNGLDDDCDGSADEGLNVPLRCGLGACQQEVSACEAGVPGQCEPGRPTSESCNGIDDDCDGDTDELPPVSCGLGICASTVPACTNGSSNTCHIQEDAAGPEVCNLRDDDCDGNVDEGIPDIECGVGQCRRIIVGCERGMVPECPTVDAGTEICNGLDDDCDGVVDNGVRCFDFDCALDGDVACIPGAPEGENQPPVLASDTTVYAPDPAEFCGRQPNPLDGFIGGPLTPGGGGGGRPDRGDPIIFQNCAILTHHSDPDGMPPRLQVDWGDGSADDPARFSCFRENIQRYVIPHHYTEAGAYDVVVTATDNDGLRTSLELTVNVTLPQSEVIRPCFMPPCVRQIPGSCTVSAPLLYLNENDECVPLNEQTFCDPNLPDGPCPDDACANNRGSVMLPVYTVATDRPLQWHWLGEGMFHEPLVGELPNHRCGTQLNHDGYMLEVPCGRRGTLRALGAGPRRQATIKVGNDRPEVNIVEIPETVVAGERFEVRAEASDPDGSIDHFRWEINGQQVEDREGSVSDYIESPGEHVVQVTAFDNSGARAIDAQRITVLEDPPSMGFSQFNFSNIFPADGIEVQTFEIIIPAGAGPVASAEIWLGHLSHSNNRLNRLRGRVMWTAETDHFDLIGGQGENATGSQFIAISAHSNAYRDEDDALHIQFAFVPSADFAEDLVALGPIDVAYRVELEDQTYLDASLVNADGWFNADLNAYGVDIVPEIGVLSQDGLLPGYRIQFITLVDDFIVFRHVSSGERVLIRAAEYRWDYGDGQHGDSHFHRYAHPGRYSVQLEVLYDNGWVTHSNVAEVIIEGDTDGDGIQDHLDPDRDNDGVCDGPNDVDGVCSGGPDALPRNPWQSVDADGDGVGDDIYACLRRDVPENSEENCQGDHFPDDPEAAFDTDLDGIEDGMDPDRDGDGLLDELEEQLGLSTEVKDTDGDGLGDDVEAGLFDGRWPTMDSDGDETPNHLDIDSDNDGLPDGHEPFGLDDPDGDGLASIIDSDADNDGVEDGLDRTPWAVYAPAQSDDFWKDEFPAGYMSVREQFAVFDWRGELHTLGADFELEWPWEGPGEWVVDGDWEVYALPDTETDDLHGDILDQINLQLGEQEFVCSNPRWDRNDHRNQERFVRHEYDPVGIIHEYWEVLLYRVRQRMMEADCQWMEAKPVLDELDRRFWHSTAGIQLRTGVDNTLIFQFTLNPLFNERIPYGEGADVGYANPMGYILPAFEYRLYDRRVDDGGDWRNAIGIDSLRFHGNALAHKSVGRTIDGRPVFEVRIQVPRQAIENPHHWLMLSPRLEFSTEDGGFTHLALDPRTQNLRITAFEHHFSGPIAHLVTPSSDTLDWDHVQRAIVDAHATDEGLLDMSSLMEMPTGRRIFQSEHGPLDVAILNRGMDPEARLPANTMQDQNTLDGVLILSYHPQEIVPAIMDNVTCVDWGTCRWYATDTNEPDGERNYQAGNIVLSTFKLDWTRSDPGHQMDASYVPRALTAAENQLLSDARNWQRAINNALDSVQIEGLRLNRLKFDEVVIDPMETLNKAFDRHSIEVVGRAGGRYQPLYDVRIKASAFDDIEEGFDIDNQWAGREVGVKLENDILVERISTGWDEDGRPIPPKEFLQHGDRRITGTTAGGRVITKLYNVELGLEEQNHVNSLRTTKLGFVLDGLGVGAAVFGFATGVGMLYQYDMDEDGFWEGGILTGQSVIELYTESRAAYAGFQAYRAGNLAAYGTAMARASKWAKISVFVGSGAELVLGFYYLHKAANTDDPRDRRRYAQKVQASSVNAVVTIAYPVGTAVAAIYSLSTMAYTYFDLPRSEFVRAEVADLGSLFVNIRDSIRSDRTELWKIESLMDDAVYPLVNFWEDIVIESGIHAVRMDFPAGE